MLRGEHEHEPVRVARAHFVLRGMCEGQKGAHSCFMFGKWLTRCTGEMVLNAPGEREEWGSVSSPKEMQCQREKKLRWQKTCQLLWHLRWHFLADVGPAGSGRADSGG